MKRLFQLILACLAVSAGAATLQWTDNSWDEDGFRIYKNGVLYATADKDTTTLTVTEPGDYYVTAVNYAGESKPTNTVTIDGAVAPTNARISVSNEATQQPTN